MSTNAQQPDTYSSTTKRALIVTSLFNEPLEVLFHSFAAVILVRDLHASYLQIALYTMCKPMVSLFSLYWSLYLQQRPHRLVKNVLLTGFLSRLPFLFMPFISNPWLFILCSASYMTLMRGGFPSWTELINQNMPSKERNTFFSLSSASGYLEGVFIGLSLGFLLDRGQETWRYLFPCTALIGMGSLFVQATIPERMTKILSPETHTTKELLLLPWKKTLHLLKQQTDFRFFQIGFMAAGAGLMLMAPAVPIFFVKYLNLSYTEVAGATTIAKSLGFVVCSQLWSRFLNHRGIQITSGLVFFGVALYPLLLIFAIFYPPCVYIALFVYGAAQSGSHLTWHLSGSIFANGKNSQSYSDVNVLAVGIRGSIIPPLGGLVLAFLGPLGVFCISSLLCIAPSWFFVKRTEEKQMI